MRIDRVKVDLDELKLLLRNKHLPILKERYHVREIGIFGSVARGENTKNSDIDILVEFSHPIGFFKFIELEDYLSKIFEQKVDLVTKKALKSAIRDEVLREVVYV